MITTEKRKNSDKHSTLSLGFAIVLLLGGILAGMGLTYTGMVQHSTSESLVLEAQARVTDVDLSGEWIGTVTEDYGAEGRYDYRLVITQDGDALSGTNYLDLTASEIYAEQALDGSVDGNTVTLTEMDTLVLENLSLDHWCMATYTLTYQVLNGQEMLVGTWVSAEPDRDGCDTISGRLILTRQSD